MKRHLLFVITALTLLGSTITSHADDGTLGFGNGANPNPHNLSSQNTVLGKIKASTETQICIFCHTPHGARPAAPLWNRPNPTGSFSFRIGTLSINDAAIVNTTRYSPATSGVEGYPNGTSKLCLSCHDGVTAMGILADGTSIGMTGSGLVTAGINLSTSHPVSFVYTSAVVQHLNDVVLGSYVFPEPGLVVLETRSGTTWVQCTSCHQPHQNTRVVPGNSLPFWRDTTTASTNTAYNNICGKCHTSTYTQVSPNQFPDHNF